MTRPPRPGCQPPEPSTESYAELVAWLRGPPRRSQALLAIACHISQPTLSQYIGRRARPNPDREVALLLQLATGGKVTPLGWMTAAERAERRRRRAHATHFARAIATGRRVLFTTKVATVPVRVGANDSTGSVSRPKKAASSRAGGRQCARDAALQPAGGSTASAGGTVDIKEGAPPPSSLGRRPRTSSDELLGVLAPACDLGAAT
jgi:hypothetical protein